ncbi:MAG: hypothetical protein QOE70_6531 [Chthoniobacter sp.]|jgi:hypothetical protein|nr:hypothetical protein [Chthoniobacter sp.]
MVAGPNPRIFVSHSAKEKHAAAALERIELELNKEFDVFIDRFRLQPGQLWRNELFTRMYRSHGAVILFSEHAFESDFVPTEVSILGSRPYLDADFKLLPVLLDGVTVEQVERKFSAVRLSELQVIQGGTPEEIAAAVRKAFLPLIPKQAAQTPFDKLEVMIANLLKEVPPAALRGAALRLGSDLSVWEPDANLQTQLARELWQADLIISTAAINEDLSSFLDKGQFESLVELIAPSWVDPRLAVSIPGVAKGHRDLRALGVNGTIAFTAQMFVRRACCRGPSVSWRIAPIAAAWDDRATDCLRTEITVALKSEFGMDQDEDDAILRAILEARETGLNEPVFVMFPPPTPPREVLKELRVAFPTVTFFLLTGEHLPAPGEADTDYFQPLVPGLPPGQEWSAYIQYRTARSVGPHEAAPKKGQGSV